MARHDTVIDYTREDFTGKTGFYDVVFDAVGKFPGKQAKKTLGAGGVYLNVMSSSNNIKLVQKDLVDLKGLVEQGVLRSVIDRSYSLEDIVEAHHYVEQGHKKGNVVVNVS